MQRRSSGFLRADENEIEPLDFATLGSKHRYNLHGERCTGKLSAAPTSLLPLRLRSIVRLCRIRFAPFFPIPFSFWLSQ
jgi:hypothetical protein